MSNQVNYNPDVLSCIANLSNDEVFTPPELANEVLDLLPKEIWKDKNAKFLDPFCKSGIFLREIAKRLLEGIVDEIPNLQERIDHIFHNQIYGIAITELTSLLSRRSVYCSKYPNCKYSISKFDDVNGNIRFKKINHTWVDGKCAFCGASKKELNRDSSLESYAYEFIHVVKPEEIFNMKFDVIVGNPPYQLNVGNDGGNASKAKSIYHKFVDMALKLKPRYITMIIESRWMTKSTEGISEEWVDKMIDDHRIRVLHDYLTSNECFPNLGNPIKGGVCYFLWDRQYNGNCDYYLHDVDTKIYHRNGLLDPFKAGIVIRDHRSMEIIEKIVNVEGNYFNTDIKCFSSLVSPKDFFTNKETLTSSWKGYVDNKDSAHSIKYYLNKNIHKKDFGYVSLKDISKNHDSIKLTKVYIPAAGGNGADQIILGKPFLGDSNSVCSQTYLVIGYDPQKHNFNVNQCENIISYIKTKFFRYLVSIKKKTQNGPRGVYQFVPLQDFNEEWTDEKLYKKYDLTQEQIDMIENAIRPLTMDAE